MQTTSSINIASGNKTDFTAVERSLDYMNIQASFSDIDSEVFVIPLQSLNGVNYCSILDHKGDPVILKINSSGNLMLNLANATAIYYKLEVRVNKATKGTISSLMLDV